MILMVELYISTDSSESMISMHSTPTTAVSMADFSSAIRIKSLKVTPTLQAVPNLLVISTAVPIGVGVVLLITAVLSIALSLYFIHGKHDMYNYATCAHSLFCTIGKQGIPYSISMQILFTLASCIAYIKLHFLIKDECHRITL